VAGDNLAADVQSEAKPHVAPYRGAPRLIKALEDAPRGLRLDPDSLVLYPDYGAWGGLSYPPRPGETPIPPSPPSPHRREGGSRLR
jgi:hypothetical protein